MSNDAHSETARDGEPRSSAVHGARAQVEAARLRQQHLVASGRLAATGAEEPPPITALPGYTIVRELHRGGQGVVYLAVQKSTDRQVAIKLLKREWPHRSGVAALARFEREIEVLSRLKHPNIVMIHDCGRDHGHVYLVMDYVIGRPLDTWVRRETTALAETLDVFARICDGVNAAHLRGVIHRDLKPGNILVDERGEPHVLDFGLAKLVEEPIDPFFAQPMTVTGQFVGSLPWASPEQAEGRTETLDIRTDVYSLGVILYQLLTGQFPYPVSGRLSEVVRHIVDSDPVRPSTIDRDIDRELETILLKCLAKQRERRYQNAGELARDIRRYLAGEAIEARRDSLAYVMSKRLARYRAAAITAAAMLLVLTIALIVSIKFWREAAHQETVAKQRASEAQQSAIDADREASEARAVTTFLREIITSVEPENQGADVRLIQVLQNASAEASQRFIGHPQQEAEVRDLLGQVYDRLSMWNEARAEFGHAAENWLQVAGPDDRRTLAVRSRHLQESLNLGQAASVESALHELAARLERVCGPDDVMTLTVQRDVAIAALQRGRVDEAERALLDLRARPQLADDDASHIRLLVGLIGVHTNRLSSVEPEGVRAILLQAESLTLEWIERSTRLFGPDATMTLQARVKWAEFACSLGEYRVAAEACRGILDHSAGRLGACHSLRTSAMSILADALTGLGDDIEPARLHLQRLQCLREQLAPDNVLFLASVSDSLRYIERAGLAAEGETLARELSGSLAKYGGGHDEMALASDLFVAHFISMQDRLDEAEPLFRTLLAQGSRLEADSRTRSRIHLYYAHHLIRRGDFEQALAQLDEASRVVGDVRVGTWDAQPDDIARGYIALYRAWNKPEKVEEFKRLCNSMRPQVESQP